MKKNRNTDKLITEQINKNTINIDQLDTEAIVDLIHKEDLQAYKAVASAKKEISKAAMIVTQTIKNGGKIFFIGAGTSGRLGVLEAAECPPTFGTDPKLFNAIIAGGHHAVWKSKEGAEDNEKGAISELEKKLKSKDTVVGITASSSTPFVMGALEYSKKIGCKTILIGCNPIQNDSVDIFIYLPVGPEVIAGSTRMKSATATKMTLNIITTTAMIQVGKTYGNLMVDLQPKSQKLKDRAIRIVRHICKVDKDIAEKLLKKSKWNVKAAIVMRKKGVSLEEALDLLNKTNGVLYKIIGPYL